MIRQIIAAVIGAFAWGAVAHDLTSKIIEATNNRRNR